MRTLVLPGLLTAFLLAAGCLSLNDSKRGTPVPPFEGVDSRGQLMRLGEHKNKVVLLSFWHSHCPPCRAMFAHEKKLVEKYRDRPFVLLGVNADASPLELRTTEEKAGLTWTSFWDGVGGPITSGFAVDRFPTFILIDPEGKHRWQLVGVPSEGELEKKITELLDEIGKRQS